MALTSDKNQTAETLVSFVPFFIPPSLPDRADWHFNPRTVFKKVAQGMCIYLQKLKKQQPRDTAGLTAVMSVLNLWQQVPEINNGTVSVDCFRNNSGRGENVLCGHHRCWGKEAVTVGQSCNGVPKRTKEKAGWVIDKTRMMPTTEELRFRYRLALTVRNVPVVGDG